MDEERAHLRELLEETKECLLAADEEIAELEKKIADQERMIERLQELVGEFVPSEERWL